ncbi:hypothetical protein HYALB_00001336 [Hymenoscyphus albidus]|uniref:Uncharacterized protein n=1 Tax=Hymenoscyphus albidus TaxID=595503 RepID=A0A9N9Q473_9HELO|nr:hypothetical protein HYALB_00001336 [Hymenoscyphus albidus]
MERRLHSGRRGSESRRRDKEKRHHHESHNHRLHHRGDGRDRVEKTEKHRSHEERPPIGTATAPALSESKDYVHRWLAATNAEVATRRGDLQPEEPSNISESKRESKLARQFAHLENHQNPAHTNRAQPKPKEKHNVSSDSSLLEAQYTTPRVQPVKSGREKRLTEQEQSPRPHKRCRTASTTSSSRKSSVDGERPKETFERRARHKTREDRYAPKAKDHKADKKQEKKRTTTKRAKKKNNPNPKKNGEELMRDFSSKNIGHDRLTIRPPYSLGLFGNGRTSDAAKDKGIPDLAFSDMDFLQKSERPRPIIEMEHLKSKSREKEKRKLLKSREDIEDLSAFFNQYRKPLQEVNNNRGSGFSEETSQTQLESNHPPMKQSLYARQRDPSPIRGSQPPSLVSAGRLTDAASKVSGKATTYVSWSETQFSPVKVLPAGIYDRRQVSPIPDAVQKSIEETGVYRNTGIQMRPYPQNSPTRLYTSTKEKQSEKRQKGTRDGQRKRGHDDDDGVNGFLPRAVITSVSSSHQAQSSPRRREIRLHKLRHGRKHENIIEAQSRGLNAHDSSTSGISSNRPTTSKESRENLVLKHYDRESGWHQKGDFPNDHQEPSNSPSVSVIPETPLLDRVQIAKKARVKRPSTTLPVVSIAASEKNTKGEAIATEKQGVRPATIEPVTTGSTSQMPQSTPLPLHDSMHPNQGEKSGQADQNPTGEQHGTSDPRNPGGSHADVNVPNQGPTPQSLAESLHQSRGSSSTIKINHNASTLRINNPVLLGGLPLRGGLAHQFDPASRMLDMSSMGALFIRQAQHSDTRPQQFFPEFIRPQIGNNMNSLETESPVPSLVDNYQPSRAEYQSRGPIGMEIQGNGVYPEGESYDSMYDGANQGQMFENDLDYAQETFQNNLQYDTSQLQGVGSDVKDVNMGWYEGARFQHRDDDGAYYDDRFLGTEVLQEETFPDENEHGNFMTDEGFIQRDDYQDEASYYPENEWRHQQLY